MNFKQRGFTQVFSQPGAFRIEPHILYALIMHCKPWTNANLSTYCINTNPYTCDSYWLCTCVLCMCVISLPPKTDLGAIVPRGQKNNHFTNIKQEIV